MEGNANLNLSPELQPALAGSTVRPGNDHVLDPNSCLHFYCFNCYDFLAVIFRMIVFFVFQCLLTKQKLLVYMGRPQQNFEPHPNPKNSLVGPKKAQKRPENLLSSIV